MARSPVADLEDARTQILRRSVVLRELWLTYTQRLTSAGRWLFWPTLLILLYANASAQVQYFLPLAYLLGLWFCSLLGAWIFRPKVELRARHAERIGAGEMLVVDLELQALNRWGLRDARLWPHRLPPTVSAELAEGLPLPELRRGERARLALRLHCAQRGPFVLKGFRAATGFPFGLWERYQIVARESSLLVYPRFQRLAQMHLPLGRRYQPGGVPLAAPVGEALEYAGNREYRAGDNVRHFDWRATARLGRPVVREYREEYFFRLAVVLDTQLPRRARAAERDAFEGAIELAASASEYIARQDYLVDIFAAGPRLYHLTAGRSLAYLDQILDILACVESTPEPPFATLEPELAACLAQLTTVVVILLDWDPPRQEFVQRLSEQGPGLRVVVVRDRPCTADPAIPGPWPPVTVLETASLRRGLTEL